MNTKRPNIIFILADDLGYADLGCYGGRSNKFGPVSPNIDSLAENGIKFTDGYSNSSVCSPTRFALITGNYQYRFRGAAEEPLSIRSKKNYGVPNDYPTIPRLLQENGYKTALIGKWHLGMPPDYGPLKCGYQEFFGPLTGAVDYFTHQTAGGKHDLWDNEESFETSGYLTDILSDRAVTFINENADSDNPFFLSLHYTAPHWPWESRDDFDVSKDPLVNLFHLHGGNVETYQKMINHMDEGIGRIVSTLKESNLLENTLIIFTSDNGGERFSDNWPLVGGKMELTEGGIRVPYIAHWPEKIPKKSISNQNCLTMDWSVTVLDVAGINDIDALNLDGISLFEVLKNPEVSFKRDMFWRMKNKMQRAFRSGPWKYLKVDENEYLFNLNKDSRERANLAEVEKDKFIEMKSAWESWNKSMPPIPEDAVVGVVYTEKNMPKR